MNPTTEIAILAQNIRLLRRTHRLTAKETAEIMSISADALELLESGELPLCMDVESLFRLSKYFNIPIADLFRPTAEITENQK